LIEVFKLASFSCCQTLNDPFNVGPGIDEVGDDVGAELDGGLRRHHRHHPHPHPERALRQAGAKKNFKLDEHNYFLFALLSSFSHKDLPKKLQNNGGELF
jgi:hypothetical protein